MHTGQMPTGTDATVAAGLVLCPLCGASDTELGNGPGGRAHASCRTCGSLERHRCLALLARAFVPEAASGLVLDVAPSKMTTPVLSGLTGSPYVGMDFDPAADNRSVTVQASLTDIPLADGAVGLMVCFHVLEHIPDDAAAMAQIARVLGSEGVALVQVPARAGVTDEDPSASPEERLRRFGQADHVRYYGDDFDDRLAAAGLHVTRVEAQDLLSADLVVLFGLNPREPVWVCQSPQAASPLDLAAVQDKVAAAQIEVLTATLRSAAQQSAGGLATGKSAQQWHQRYEQLHARPEVKAVTALRQSAGRAKRAAARAKQSVAKRFRTGTSAR